jgi:hypothetical protein
MSTRRQVILGVAGALVGAADAWAKERPVLVNAHHTS